MVLVHVAMWCLQSFVDVVVQPIVFKSHSNNMIPQIHTKATSTIISAVPAIKYKTKHSHETQDMPAAYASCPWPCQFFLFWARAACTASFCNS